LRYVALRAFLRNVFCKRKNPCVTLRYVALPVAGNWASGVFSLIKFDRSIAVLQEGGGQYH